MPRTPPALTKPARPPTLALTAALPMALALAGLFGCAAPGPQFAPACPTLSLLRDAADLSRYAGTGRDLSDLSLQARIAAVPATCTWAEGRTKVRATLQVTFDLTRGPAATSRQLEARYFVAVTKGDAVLDEQDYTLAALFPPNTDRAQFSSNKIDLLLPVSGAVSAAAYQIYVGFRLSPDELQANRQLGR